VENRVGREALKTAKFWTRFNILKFTIYSLLALNLYFFLVHGSLNEVLDSLGWLILLGTFEFETGQPAATYAKRWQGWAVMGAQAVAYCFIVFALIGYFLHEEWPDFINAVLWLLVVGTIAYDVYAPGAYGGLEWRIRNSVKFGLYISLFVMALWWGVTGEVLDFYDAALWIVCFLIIELNVFNVDKPASQEAAAQLVVVPPG
jgi:hypothetical protein